MSLKVLDLSFNDIKEIPESLINLRNLEKLNLKGNPVSRMKGLNHKKSPKKMIELRLLDMLPFFEPYQKYIVLSKLTVEKNYLIVSLAYVFESVREYCSYRFREVCQGIEFKDDYERNHAVMGVIGGFSRDNKIVSRHRNIYRLNKSEFRKVNKLYNKLRKRRNDLAHINRTKDFATIKEDLKKIIKEVEVLFDRGVLAEVQF